MVEPLTRRDLLGRAAAAGAALSLAGAASRAAGAAPARKPNIIFILADDMGWGDAGCYGQKMIRTPNIDRLAEQGTRFTNCYTASAVCAPTRCGLMTGLHTGHCTRRDNRAQGKVGPAGDGLIPLRAEDLTVATLLKRAGYATGAAGKWGLGNPGTTGTPEQHGVDHFLGYLDQVHAHNYYTDYLYRDGERITLEGNTGGKKEQYTHDLFEEDTLKWIRAHRDGPFFWYGTYTLPHGQYVIPSDAPYTAENWPQQQKNYAAMITRLDGTVGRMLDLLKELGIEEETLVFFASDNGPNPPFFKHFRSAGPFRGTKSTLYEGGIRCPMVARWPGRVPAGRVSDFAWSQVDFLATACELAGIAAPQTDGMSVLPTLLGKGQKPHDALYWEFHSPFQQAARMGDWKGIRFGTKEPLALYDLKADPAEAHDVAAAHPDVVRKMEAYLATARTDSPYYPVREYRQKGKAGGGGQE